MRSTENASNVADDQEAGDATEPDGTVPNEEVGEPKQAAFVHLAVPENTVGNSTYLDHPVTNNNPDALLFVTQNWDPGGNPGSGRGASNEHPTVVWYDADAAQWAIYDRDLAAIPEEAFNVAVV
jgi:hypothetical protein